MRGWRGGRIQIFVGDRNLAAGRADTQRVDHAACVGHMYYRRVDVASRVELAGNRPLSKGAGAFDPHVADPHPPGHHCANSRGAALAHDRGVGREWVEAHYEITIAVEVENQPQHYLLCGCLLIQIICAAGQASRLESALSPGPTPKRGQKAEQDRQEEGREAARFSVARTHQWLLPSKSAL